MAYFCESFPYYPVKGVSGHHRLFYRHVNHCVGELYLLR